MDDPLFMCTVVPSWPGCEGKVEPPTAAETQEWLNICWSNWDSCKQRAEIGDFFYDPAAWVAYTSTNTWLALGWLVLEGPLGFQWVGTPDGTELPEGSDMLLPVALGDENGLLVATGLAPGKSKGWCITCVVVTAIVAVMAYGLAGAACVGVTVGSGGPGAVLCGAAWMGATAITGLAWEASANPGMDGGDVFCTLAFGPSNPAVDTALNAVDVSRATVVGGGGQALEEIGEIIGIEALDRLTSAC